MPVVFKVFKIVTPKLWKCSMGLCRKKSINHCHRLSRTTTIIGTVTSFLNHFTSKLFHSVFFSFPIGKFSFFLSDSTKFSHLFSYRISFAFHWDFSFLFCNYYHFFVLIYNNIFLFSVNIIQWLHGSEIFSALTAQTFHVRFCCRFYDLSTDRFMFCFALTFVFVVHWLSAVW